MKDLMSYNDLLIAIAYFSIPFQLVLSLFKYPRLHAMPLRVLVLAILFTLFIFSCGLGHLLRFLGMHNEVVFDVVNIMTMLISVATAIYLIPLVPNLMSSLDNQITELLRQNEEVAAFTAFLCHEIRTPLFCITSAATFWEDGDNIQEAVSSIKTSANLILRLVNDVLDISRLEAGKVRFEERPFLLTEMLDHISSTTASQLKKKTSHVAFIEDIAEDTPKVVLGDSARMSQVLNNLTSNAIKYTEEGKIGLHVSTLGYEEALNQGLVTAKSENKKNCPESADDADSSDDSACQLGSLIDCSVRMEEGKLDLQGQLHLAVLKLEVQDTGCGIPADRVDQIFQPYTQAKLSDYRRHGGTGLGLSITTKLVAAMNGSLHVKSVDGEGSTFTIYLPILTGEVSCPDALMVPIASPCKVLKEASLPATPDTCPMTPSPSLPSLSLPAAPLPSTPNTPPKPCIIEPTVKDSYVLLVDDNPTNCKLLGRMLKHFQLDYKIANNGQEAVDIIRQSKNVNPDKEDALYCSLIFMDWQMPIMDGREATETLRQRYKLDIPIVALTANVSQKHRDDAMEAGADEFATKPILREDLYKKCQYYLCERNQHSSLPKTR